MRLCLTVCLFLGWFVVHGFIQSLPTNSSCETNGEESADTEPSCAGQYRELIFPGDPSNVKEARQPIGGQLDSGAISLPTSTPIEATFSNFDLKPGLELHYTVQAGYWYDGEDGKPIIPRNDDGSVKYEQYETAVYVLNQQENGGFRVVMKGTSAAGSPYLTWADLFADGRLVLIPSAMPTLEFDSFRSIFPRLAMSEIERQNGWEEIEPRTNVKMQFSELAETIQAKIDTPLLRLSAGSSSITYRLDPKRKLPIEIQCERRFESYGETHSVNVSLTEAKHNDGAWVATMQENAEHYFSALNSIHQFRRLGLVSLAMGEREKVGSALEQLETQRALLDAAKDQITAPLFRELMDESIENFTGSFANSVANAEHWAQFVGLPIADLTIADLTGKEHSLRQFTGRVVVLDFWFRECSFCIRAMPQIEQVHAKFLADRAPVTFLGFSIDEDAADAQHVVDTMKLDFPVLRSKELATQLGVKSFPTLLVIAPDGTLQGIFVGYSPTIQEDLTDCIHNLLKR